jgi:Fe-S cluster assembly protein SufB
MDASRNGFCNWKYPSVILKGDNSVGEFYSIATNNFQQADTGTK